MPATENELYQYAQDGNVAKIKAELAAKKWCVRQTSTNLS